MTYISSAYPSPIQPPPHSSQLWLSTNRAEELYVAHTQQPPAQKPQIPASSYNRFMCLGVHHLTIPGPSEASTTEPLLSDKGTKMDISHW